MDNTELLDRLDLIEFRQELLFENTDYARLLYDNKVTREQKDNISELFSSLRNSLDNGEEIMSSSNYESKIYEIVPHRNHNYHFAENIARVLHKEGRYEEVFVALYGDNPKFDTYLNK